MFVFPITKKHFVFFSWGDQMSDMPPRMQADRSGG